MTANDELLLRPYFGGEKLICQGGIGYLASDLHSVRIGERVAGKKEFFRQVRQECRNVGSGTLSFKCSECGCWVAYDEDWSTGVFAWVGDEMRSIFPHYCPNCGRRVVE